MSKAVVYPPVRTSPAPSSRGSVAGGWLGSCPFRSRRIAFRHFSLTRRVTDGSQGVGVRYERRPLDKFVSAKVQGAKRPLACETTVGQYGGIGAKALKQSLIDPLRFTYGPLTDSPRGVARFTAWLGSSASLITSSDGEVGELAKLCELGEAIVKLATSRFIGERSEEIAQNP